MRCIFCALMTCVVAVGCSDKTETETSFESSIPSKSDASTESTVESEDRVASEMVPEGVSYSVMSSDVVPGVKRSLNVRLNEKVSEEVLRAIALDLKSQDSRKYDRTFIMYYLPGMTIGAGAWATTHFNPTLDVRIQGPTVEQEEGLTLEPTLAGQDVIGHWFDDSPFVGSRITIFRENGNVHAQQKFMDGSSREMELVEQTSPLGRRFDNIAGSPTGDHWIIDKSGDLQMWDDQGLIRTARKSD